jgi:cold shock CspA family protein
MVVRFDDVRGYGFIAPDGGGGDVFLHANDLEIDRTLLRSGARVSFEIEEGARGKFATAVRSASALPVPEPGRRGPDSVHDDYSDVLDTGDFQRLVTEMLLHVAHPLTGVQIVEIRSHFEALARRHGWVEDFPGSGTDEERRP